MDSFDGRSLDGLFTLFVDNLPNNMTNVWLKQLFMNFGVVVDSFVSRKSRRGLGGVFGFVRFKKEDEAKEAICKNNNLVIKGKKIWVQMSKFARTKVTKVRDVKRHWGGQLKEIGSIKNHQSGSYSFVNAVTGINKVVPVVQEKVKGVVDKHLSMGICSNERDLVEGWVKQLTFRDCVEEKLVVSIGDKSMLVHGVLINTPTESMGGEERLEKEVIGVGLLGLPANPIVEFLTRKGVSIKVDDCETGRRVEFLFPEIIDQKGETSNSYKISRESLNLSDVKNIVDVIGTQDGEGQKVAEIEPPLTNSTNISVETVCNDVVEPATEYCGPWAPGYFKGSCSGVSKNPIMLIGDQLSDQGEANLECEEEEQSNGSNLSLPPGFASSIPLDVIRSAKMMKKKKEVKMKNDIPKVKVGTDGSISVTSSFKKIGNKTNNSLTTKEVMDFALLMGLNKEGKEIETQRKISKILQDKRVEWEKLQLEK